MSDTSAESPEWQPRDFWACAVLFLLPVSVGLVFLADSCGDGDSPVYRYFVRSLMQTGRMPVGPMEWLHPGHYLMVWPLVAAGSALGLDDDPLGYIAIWNAIGLGWLSLEVYRFCRAFLPAAGRQGWMFAGLLVATCPGWLMYGQQVMSDVVGHAFVAIAVLRWLRHEREGERAWLPWIVTGWVSGWAGMIRISAGLFLPMLVYVVARIAWRPGSRHLVGRALFGIAVGGVAPILAVYDHLIDSAGGWEQFAAQYFSFSHDNAASWERLRRLGTNLPLWGEHVWLGVGPLTTVAGVIGLAMLLSRSRVALVLVLMMLPYFYGVAMNRAADLLRYQLPTMMWLCAGVAFLGMRLPERRRLTLLAAVLVLHALTAYPVLSLFSSRTNIIDGGARRLVEQAPDDALFLASVTRPHLLYYHRPPQQIVSPHFDTAVPADAPGLVSRRALAGIAHNRVGNGDPVWYTNEIGLDGPRAFLREQGFVEKVVVRVDGERFRNHAAPILRALDAATFARFAAAHPLELIRLELGPGGGTAPALALHFVPAAGEPGRDPGAPRLEIRAPAHPGARYRLVFGTLTSPGRFPHGYLMLPFAADDELARQCLVEGLPERIGFPQLQGELDAMGTADFALPPDLTWKGGELAAVAVLYDPPGSPQFAAIVSAPVVVRR